jgi:hypothetical protein
VESSNHHPLWVTAVSDGVRGLDDVDPNSTLGVGQRMRYSREQHIGGSTCTLSSAENLSNSTTPVDTRQTHKTLVVDTRSGWYMVVAFVDLEVN